MPRTPSNAQWRPSDLTQKPGYYTFLDIRLAVKVPLQRHANEHITELINQCYGLRGEAHRMMPIAKSTYVFAVVLTWSSVTRAGEPNNLTPT